MMPATTDPTRGLGRLASAIHRRPGRTLLLWVAAIAAAFGLASVAGGEWSSDYSTPGSDSKAAATALETRFGQGSTDTVDVVWRDPDGATRPATVAVVDRLLADAAGLPGVASVPAAASAERSEDGTTGLVRIALQTRAELVPEATGTALVALGERAADEGLELALGGGVIQQAESEGLPAETLPLLIAALVLVLALGSIVAAGLPLVTALLGLGTSVGLILALSAVVDVPDWGLSVAIMIGLGVGIDYALLLLTRHLAALRSGATVHDALVETTATAGRSVLVAGSTVVISVLGLFLMGLGYLRGVALATVLAVLISMAAAVTLLPAVLALLGRRAAALRVPGIDGGGGPRSGAGARRWARTVQRGPWVALTAGLVVIGVLAAPALDTRLGFPDAGNDLAETQSRQAFDLIAAGFGPGANGALYVVAATPSGAVDDADLAALRRGFEADAGVRSVSDPQRSEQGDAAVLVVTPTTAPQAPETRELIDRVRDKIVPRAGTPLAVDVGGATAASVDQAAVTASRLPSFIGGVVLLSMLLLLVAFRSLPVALKAAAMTLLSIAAALGVVAVLAQGGALGGLIGIDEPVPVAPYIPVMLFAILFGLSMDYEVFLMSRIKEERATGRTASEAVVAGMGATARVIAAAAAIMVAVFGGFGFGDDVGLKLIGVGLASAVFIDATVVRLLLVPSVLALLGERAWWLPASLDRILPHVDLEAPDTRPATEVAS